MTLALDDNLRAQRHLTAAAPLAGGAVGLWLLYVLVFLATGQDAPGRAMAAAVANVAPLMALAAAVLALAPRLMRLAAYVQAAVHVVLALVFVFAWYGAAMMLLAGLDAAEGRGFHISGFSGPALAWQLFQGVVLYAAIAAIGNAVARSAAPPIAAVLAARPLERYLIRAGEQFRPIEVGDIVTITGAQDYCEVVTIAGRHLVRMSLAEFENRLDPNRFIRVHRSTIIHLARLEQAELAGGGRMLAHMTDGQRVPVSRAGVKALRPLIV